MHCSSCGTALQSGVRFCHRCGAAVATAPKTAKPPAPPSRSGDQAAEWRGGIPWALAGAAVGALITVLVMRGAGGAGGGSEAAQPVSGSRVQAPDISQMSPEEMARRLFDRVMRLAEEGKADSVTFFVPMALQVYGRLPALDNDARYDIGLLHLAAGNAAGALAQADTLIKAVPTHLYAFILRARAYELLGDARRARQAQSDFLRNEPAERQRGRPEYANHQTTIDAFHAEATRQGGTRQ